MYVWGSFCDLGSPSVLHNGFRGLLTRG